MKLILPLVFVVCCAPAWAQNPLSVRVLDADGKPIAGALVVAQVYTREAPELAPETTDATGNATFSLPNADDGKPATARILAGAKGYSFNNAGSAGGKAEVRLERGQTWRGKVVDEKGAPLAGAQISVRSAMKGHDFSSVIFLDGDALTALYSAQSKADGSFEIPGLPADRDLSYRVTAPGFASIDSQHGRIGTAELFKLVPGGALRGRALGVAGQPLAKIRVYAVSERAVSDLVKTDANGAFVIAGLVPGTYALNAELPPSAAFLMPRLEGVRVEAHQTATASVWRALTGAEIRGIARDAVTKKPLANASFAAQSKADEKKGDDAAWATSDPTGRFVLRVMPGQYKVRVGGAPFGYLRSNVIQTAETKAGAPELIFELQSAPAVRGVTRDENGQPISAQLIVGEFGQTISSDARGQWQYAPSSANALTFGGGEDESGYFEVVSPKRLDWPTKGAVVVTVRHKPWQTLEGRVVTPDGTPVEGAKVKASFLVQLSDIMSRGAQVSALSDAEGRYKLERLRDSRRPNVGGTEVEVSAQKDGFQFVSGGQVTREGDQPRASDLVFVPLSSSIEGTTRAGAQVVVAGRETRADDAGRFRFEALPQGKNIVYAAQGELFGSADAAQTPLAIRLERPVLQGRDPALADELWAQAMQGVTVNDIENLGEWQSQLDFAEALKRAQASGEAWKVAEALRKWKRGDSLELLRAGLEAPAPSEERTGAFLRAAIKADDADLTVRALEIADAQFETPTKSVVWREPQLYRAAVLIERRDGAEAGAFALRTALAYTLKNHPANSRIEGAHKTATGRNDALANVAAIVAEGSPAMLREFLDSIESGSGFAIRARAEAVPVVARAHGFAAAVPLLEELQKMPAPTLDTERRYMSFDADWAFGQAVHDAIPFIGATDPARALEWARKVEGDEQSARALASAARFQTLEVAAPLLREAVAKISSEDAPRVAAYAWERDPQLGLELFEVARQKADDDMKGEMNWRDAWIPFAFYYARANPAQSRLILEREWAVSREAKADADALAAIAIAMAPLDARRAATMARELTADGNRWSFDAQVKIARYLVADDEARRGFTLNRNGAREAWDAGKLQW